MKELYTNNISAVTYEIFVNGIATPADGSVVVSVADEQGNAIITNVTANLVTNTTNKYSAVIPPQTEEKRLKATWTFAVQSQSQVINDWYEVVTIYADWYQFQSTTSYSDFLEREKVARLIINRCCGQNFYQEDTTYAIQGRGMDGLQLPKRLISLTNIDWPVFDVPQRPGMMTADTPADITWEIIADGWILRMSTHQAFLDPVYWRDATFRRASTYNVTGSWGWKTIPSNISEAANILVADLLCDQHTYRDRYLSSVKFGDWRLQFDARVFESTGNVLADQLIEDYRIFPGIGAI